MPIEACLGAVPSAKALIFKHRLLEEHGARLRAYTQRGRIHALEPYPKSSHTLKSIGTRCYPSPYESPKRPPSGPSSHPLGHSPHASSCLTADHIECPIAEPSVRAYSLIA